MAPDHYCTLVLEELNVGTVRFRGPRSHHVRSALVTIWNINADDPKVLDYNEEYKSPGQVTSLYSSDQYRSSDHDPVIVGLELGREWPHPRYLPLMLRD